VQLIRPIRRPAHSRSAFAGFRFPLEVIVLAVRWYLRFGLSYRDVEELLAERGIAVDHVTVHRWVQRFAPLLADAARFGRHRVGDRWQVDETYVKVAGRWFNLQAESRDDAEASHVPAVSSLGRPNGSVKRSDDLLAERGWAHGPSTFGAFQQGSSDVAFQMPEAVSNCGRRSKGPRGLVHVGVPRLEGSDCPNAVAVRSCCSVLVIFVQSA
jgi:hypothetical protein